MMDKTSATQGASTMEKTSVTGGKYDVEDQ